MWSSACFQPRPGCTFRSQESPSSWPFWYPARRDCCSAIYRPIAPLVCTPRNRSVMSKTGTTNLRGTVRLTFCALALWAAVGSARAQSQDDGKLTMRHAVTLALQNSRELALARVQYTVALNQTAVDRSAFRPNLYTGSGYAYTSGFPSLGGSPPAAFQLNYNQDIFDPALKAQQQAAEEHAKSMKLEVDRTHDDVIVRAASAFLELAN